MNRPRVFIVLGIINLLFAVVWVVKGIVMSFYLLIPYSLIERSNWSGADLRPVQALYAALEDPFFKTVWVSGNLLGVVAGMGLAVGGVGLFLARPWGRRWSLIWAGYAILAGAVTVGMNQSHLTPKMNSAMGLEHAEGALFAFVLMGELAVRWFYPVVLAIVLSRPFVQVAFEQARDRRALRGAAPAPPLEMAGEAVNVPPSPASSSGGSAIPTAQDRPPPPAPPLADQTWRDDPWNDPSAT